jgi:hypothetical protein
LKTREHGTDSLKSIENVIGRKEEVVTGEWTRYNHGALHYITTILFTI